MSHPDPSNHDSTIICPVCFHHCRLAKGQTGLCRTRRNQNGTAASTAYGRITSIALDPIEKKPLYRFHPGQPVLSVGSFGCNLSCPFCQNHEISQSEKVPYRYMEPEELVELAVSLHRTHDNIGIAFTYNEPLLTYEYILECGKLLDESGLDLVLVTNGTAEPEILKLLLPYVSAMNIDIKAFHEDAYRLLGGSLESVKRTVELACRSCHVELTTLVVEGINDDTTLFKKEVAWIASVDPSIPLHITRSFPRFRMTEISPTPFSLMQEMKGIAEEKLEHVFLGNI